MMTHINKNKFSYIYIFILSACIFLRVMSSAMIEGNQLVFSHLSSLATKSSIIVLFFMFLLNKKIKKNKLVVFLLSTFFILLIYISSNNLFLVQILCFIIAYPKDISSKDISKYMSIILLFSTLLVIILYKLNYATNIIVVREGIMRNSYGFSSPNVIANYSLLIFLSVAYSKQNNWKFKDSILCFLISLFVYSFTNSRMSFLLSTILSIVMLVSTLKKENDINKIHNISLYCFAISSFISILFSYLYMNNNYYQKMQGLNELLSYRLSYTSKYLQMPGISAFGKEMIFVSNKQALLTGERWSGLDNSYVYILVSWGIIGFLIYLLSIIKLHKFLLKEKNYYAFIVLIFLSIIGITENYLASVCTNLSVIFVAEMMNKKYRIEEE